MKKKITFIGFIGEGFGDFLNELHQKLQLQNINLEAIQLGAHKNAFDKTLKPHFSLLKYDNIWNFDSIKSNIEALPDISGADFYLIWNGYHDFYARIRSVLRNNKIPYLQCEYSSIKQAYLFDIGLHGDSTSLFIKKSVSENFNIKKIEEFITPGYLANNNSQNLLDEKLKKYSSFKKLLFLGLWDDAAGFNQYNSEEIQNNLSPVYRSSHHAAEALYSNLPKGWVLIIKPHPSVQGTEDTKNLKNSITQKENALWLENDVPLLELIKESDAVTTITSTTSILATYLEKPLLMLGNSYINHSTYSYNLSDYTNLKEAIVALTNKVDWDQKKSQRTLFFDSYSKANFLYSHHDILNQQGSQTVNALAEKIVRDLNNTSQRIGTSSPLKGLALVESCLLELANKQTQLQKKESQFHEIYTTLQQRDEQFHEIYTTLQQRDEQFHEIYTTLQQRDKQLHEINIVLQEKDAKLFTLRNTLNQYNTIFRKITWHSSLKKAWRRSLRTFKRELENHLNA